MSCKGMLLLAGVVLALGSSAEAPLTHPLRVLHLRRSAQVPGLQ